MSNRFAGHMPAAAAREYDAILPAVCDLHSTWRFYAELFGNKEYAALIDERAPAPFLLVHHALRSAILMAFGRVLDPAQTAIKGGKIPNLSLAHLVEVLEPHCEPAFHARLEAMLDAAK